MTTSCEQCRPELPTPCVAWSPSDRVHDTGCSLKIFRRAVVDKLQLFNGMHRFFPALALMHGFTVTEVPVRHYPRTHGLSKYGVGNRLFKCLYDLIAVRWMQTECCGIHSATSDATDRTQREWREMRDDTRFHGP